MKWAIVFYALFSVNGEPVEHISWGLTFPHHEKCIEFFDANKSKLIEGAGDFADANIEGDAVMLVELGCLRIMHSWLDLIVLLICVLLFHLFMRDIRERLMIILNPTLRL